MTFIFLIIMIPVLCFYKVDSGIISTDINTRVLGTSINSINNKDNTNVDNSKLEVINKDLLELQNSFSNNLVSASIMTDVLEIQVGTLSAYGLDCVGCSGVVGAGYDAEGNNVRYYDSKYGELRIVAGDKKYPYGTIVRIKNSTFGDFNAIVLDRGGDIGLDRRFMFDLLFYTEAETNNYALSRNTTFEILRYGY